ncbi:DUF2922 family protein [Thermosipho globiformans]|uniref:DUF2922 family protein n=1 Tax=Thermosipho globiformans TaxID=380685 RepID=UPI000F8D6248|nr:DUF2922 family protein [Thermosipho globiformans]
MKRLTLVFRNQEDGKAFRVNVQNPVENIDTAALQTDAQVLIDNGLVPEGYVFDEARVLESNTNVLIDILK